MIDIYIYVWGVVSLEYLWINGFILDFVDSFDVYIVYIVECLFVDMD